MILKPEQRLDTPAARAVIAAHPWATLVTSGEEGLIASHMPAVLDPGAPDELVILTHTARQDPQTARVVAGDEVLMIFQGEHGFLPGAWEGGDGASTGTWNFEAVHIHARPEIADRAGSLEILRRTVEHLEAARDRPTPWEAILPMAEDLVGGVCCFRLPATRVVAKAKLGENRPPEIRERLAAGLEAPGPYHQPRLAALMRRVPG